jgi:hypothetical protein
VAWPDQQRGYPASFPSLRAERETRGWRRVRPPAQPLLRRGRSFPGGPDEDCGGEELLRRLPPPPANSLPRLSSPPSRACAAGHVLPSVPRAYRVHEATGSWWMLTSTSTNRVRSEATAGEVRAGVARRRQSRLGGVVGRPRDLPAQVKTLDSGGSVTGHRCTPSRSSDPLRLPVQGVSQETAVVSLSKLPVGYTGPTL